MKRLALVALTLLTALPAFADHRDRDRDNGRWNDRNQRDRDLVVVDKDRTAWKLTKVNKQLSDAIAMARGNPALIAMLKDLRSDVDDLRDDVSSAPPLYDMLPQQPPVVVQNPPPVVVQPPQPQLYPMNDQQLRGLISAIDRENFGAAKVRVVETASMNNFFLCAQAAQIVSRMSFSNDKLAAIRAMKPKILDRQNASQLYAAFTFENEKQQLAQILNAP